MKNLNSNLAAYFQYASEEGLNFDRFVAHGGRLLGQQDFADMNGELANLRAKIASLRGEHPRLGQQLEFLANFFASDAAHPPETVRTLPEIVRNETAFALLYAAKDMDLVPDDMPEVGYLDDAAVTEVVFSRHADVFERYCADRHLEWAEIKPSSSHDQ